MTLFKNHQRPHLFYPETASKYGMNVAIVEMAIIDLSVFVDGSYRDVNLIDILERCYYLSSGEVAAAYEILMENNQIKEVE